MCQSLVMGAYSYSQHPDPYVLTTAKRGWPCLETLWSCPQEDMYERWRHIMQTHNNNNWISWPCLISYLIIPIDFVQYMQWFICWVPLFTNSYHAHVMIIIDNIDIIYIRFDEFLMRYRTFSLFDGFIVEYPVTLVNSNASVCIVL